MSETRRIGIRPITGRLGRLAVAGALASGGLFLALQTSVGSSTPAQLPPPADPPAVAVATAPGLEGADAAVVKAVGRGISEIYNAAVINPGAAASAVSRAQVLGHRDRLQSVLAKYFTGAALEHLTTAMRAALADQADSGMRDIGGGARSLTVESFSSDGSTATVEALGTVWLYTDGTGPTEGAAYHTEEACRYRLHLVSVSGEWLIDDWEVAPEGDNAP